MEIRTGEWQGGRRALLACKLKCCHLNANKTPSRARVGERGGEGEKRWSEKDGCAYGGKKKGEGERERKGGEEVDRSRDRGAYVVERKFRKESFFHPRCSYAPLEIWRLPARSRFRSTRFSNRPSHLSCSPTFEFNVSQYCERVIMSYET